MTLLNCKKCGGNHLTIKCGKEKQPLISKKEKLTCVKMTNIPDDLTVEELQKLLIEWGRIGRINFSNGSVFIDFYNYYEAEHFVKAIDKTKFDHYILSVSILK